MPVTAIIGAQYGSEGKGVIVNEIANEYDIHVRTGGPNAGHSFYHKYEPGLRHESPKLYKMQAIPCGWTNPNATLIIGAGALVSPEILLRELEMLPHGVRERLLVDEAAGILDERHHTAEGGIAGMLHQRIGSTGEGVGAAREARMQRNPLSFQRFKDVASHYGLSDLVCVNTASFLHRAHRSGSRILLEGTQGVGLSLIHGPWPYVTTNDTGAAQLAADAGVPPHFITEVIAVARTHPIRVFGNSGPLKGETTWDAMSEKVQKPVEERTTVTLKTRRIGEWDPELIDRCVATNAPTSFAVTFIDYLNYMDEGKTRRHDLSPDSLEFIHGMEQRWGTPVKYIGTGGPTWTVIRS